MIVDEGENDDEEKSNAIHHCRTTETTHYHKRALRVNSQSRSPRVRRENLYSHKAKRSETTQ